MKIQKFNERSIPLPLKVDKKLIIIRGDDWEGIYYNGKLLEQGHSIQFDKVLEKLGYIVKSNYIENENDWEQLGWALPENIEDVQKVIEIKKYNV